MSVRDHRRAPFCWQSVRAMSLIRAHFAHVDDCDPPACASDCTYAERKTAVAVMQAMSEVANELRGRDSGFEAPRKRLADYAGVTPRTLDKYVQAFEQIGVLSVDRRRVGGLNLPNLWHLVEPEGGGEMNSTTNAECATVANPTTPPLGKPDAPGSRNQTPQGRETNDAPLQEELQEPALTSRKKPDPEKLPADFPADLVPVVEQVVPVLERIASAKQALAIARAAVARTIASRPLKAHHRAACDLEVWALHGRGERRRMRDVVASYRNWLDNEPDMAPGAVQQTATNADRLQEKFAGLTRR